MEEKDKMIPYAVHELAQRHFTEVLKKCITAIIILALCIAMLATFTIYEWTRYDTIEYSYAQDGEGTNIIGSKNEVLYEPENGSPSQDKTNTN